ncbi:MAG: YihY/virulence factor BrkB family protein [Caulobacter sp.]|nr:YihY/virulence factor BrkB family protein [Caulobacter sp.]
MSDGQGERGRAVVRWLRQRPYQLLPWIVLTAAIGLWPRGQVAIAVPPSKIGLSDDRVMNPAGFEAAEPGRGRTARHPSQIPLKGWRDILWRVGQEIFVDRLPSVAGGVTFYALLAIFPAIAAFVSLYGLFADVATVQAQLAQMSGVFPTSAVQIVGDQMLRLAGQQDGKLTIALIVSLLVSVWSANAGMRALFEGLNDAYDELERRPFFRQTAISYVCTFGALVFLVTVAAVLVALPIALKAMGLSEVLAIWGPLRWLLVLALAALAFTLLYRIGPSRARARWRWLTWGAVAASLMWIGGSLGFSFYLNTVAPFDATYGPLGAVIAFMVWVWLSILIILIGAELNAEIEHQTAEDSTTGPALPMGERGAQMADTVGQRMAFGETIAGGVEAVEGVWRQITRRGGR